MNDERKRKIREASHLLSRVPVSSLPFKDNGKHAWFYKYILGCLYESIASRAIVKADLEKALCSRVCDLGDSVKFFEKEDV